jgi:hypothetical protein
MPTAATVPRTVAIAEESTANIKVFLRAFIMSLLENLSTYLLREKPSKTEVLLPELTENRTIIRRGAYKKT